MCDLIIYNPEEKTITQGNVSEHFYCGLELDNVASILVRLKFGTISIQQAHSELVCCLVKNYTSGLIKENNNAK